MLEQNALNLQQTVQDFGVRGDILAVRPGPVVTLYELEPAPGTKSSRVISLSDDIARSMSAVSARVAVVPGRNVIGIELPNDTRETVYLRELLASADFGMSKHKLALCLGKNIGGEPIIADLAKMPHLLVAGTTGSGKSVAINTMILSLLYRMKPEECRLIMVDPKMLELSVYDGIPHLLSPVVIDPKKAVIALKWAVREMEERYKKMSKIAVRNIDGYNARMAEARAKGEIITREVHTGFNRETGQAVYETEEMDLSALPYIVIVVDEMADLMMVAGKDIEGAIQRLAQMARAAGIHLIMATQRPSVDVITGTIKANFPTRISFQVTSKIDSRTILGEMGAEQLLGQGDMLFMAGGGRTTRVHGPFCSDSEVESVVAHLKRQGRPSYLEAVTADDGSGDEKPAKGSKADKADRAEGPGHRDRGHRRADLRCGRLCGQRRHRSGRRALRPGGAGGDARPQGLDELHPAPPADRLQPRRLDHGADGDRGHRRPGQPCRQARDPDGGRPRRLRHDGRRRLSRTLGGAAAVPPVAYSPQGGASKRAARRHLHRFKGASTMIGRRHRLAAGPLLVLAASLAAAAAGRRPGLARSSTACSAARSSRPRARAGARPGGPRPRPPPRRSRRPAPKAAKPRQGRQDRRQGRGEEAASMPARREARRRRDRRPPRSRPSARPPPPPSRAEADDATVSRRPTPISTA